ncbi:hypothetical protein VH1709_contig00082-0008 [Vibrio harveyi]|uniref:DNA-binding protein n=1 Tax=Vibrio harveyi TaxID=669 RepID=UPI000AEF5A8D|nr:DNA-binding protein [Vibrio harveyi]GBL01870.1 hypothetical protein VH1709_contig00082-0008 [Vibrio harveyi]
MARERAFSDQQVIEAANALLVEGKNINGTSLRNKIGTGRPSAFKELEGSGQILAPMLPDSTEQAISHQECPPEIAERLSVMLGDVELLVHQINDHAHYTVEQRLNKQTNVPLTQQSVKRNRLKNKIKRSSSWKMSLKRILIYKNS